MATSKTVIANLALSHLGVSKEIANIDTENSEEANACRRFYEVARNKVLRDFNWPFATKIAALSLVSEDPNDEWDYSYRYPSDCLNFRKIQSGTRNDSRQTRTPYRIAKDASGKVIFTDRQDAIGEYTELIETVELYPDDFVMALSFLLASYTAPRITGGDPFKLGERAMSMYEIELSNARTNSLNEEQNEELVESELIRERY